MPGVFLARREVMMLQEIQLVITNFASKINPFAHPMRNG